MLLLNRSFVCSKLALSNWQSYAVFPATKTGMIRETDVLKYINARRSANTPPFLFVPALFTAESLEELTGVPVRKLKLWARRKRNPIPHVRFNSHVVRFPAQACEWLEENSK